MTGLSAFIRVGFDLWELIESQRVLSGLPGSPSILDCLNIALSIRDLHSACAVEIGEEIS